MKNNKIVNYLINLSFFAYFLTLITERTISISLSFINNVNIFSSFFNGAVYISIFASILGFLVYLILKCRKNIEFLFKPNDENIDFKNLIIASGILLISGMVHSEYTISPLQFVSYGFFIIAIVLRVVQTINDASSKPLTYLSMVYLICYSMTIPVTYSTNLDLADLFHVISLIASYVLVGIFTFMTLEIFNRKSNLFSFFYIIPAIIFDAFIIIFRWSEEINFFVLIFIILSVILFICGRVLAYIENKKAK